ncbi:hypothetical protein MMC13_007384 [Lambiella insularis]|nr:hypothetical protein [Lambiella insularis]
MAFPMPSIGEILMLSQLAWKIGCAFTAGKAGAPTQFLEVENELKSLTNAITLLAENLDEDDSLLGHSDELIKGSIYKILSCCKQTLDDLESFVNQYQEVRRPGAAGGLATQKSWRPVLVKNYKHIMWTTEGGGIESLRNMLAMHTQSISLTMRALQSGSLSCLEKVIKPVAEQIIDVHNRADGDLDLKVDELDLAMLSLQASMEQKSPMIWSSRAESIKSPSSPSDSPVLLPRNPRRGQLYSPAVTKPEFHRQASHTSSKYSQTSQRTPEYSDSELYVQNATSTSWISKQQDYGPRESSILPPAYHHRARERHTEHEVSRHGSNRSDGTTLYSPRSSSRRSDHRYRDQSPEPLSPTMLPVAAIIPDSEPSHSRPQSRGYSILSKQSESTVRSKHIATIAEQETLAQKLFTEAAMLCEVYVVLVSELATSSNIDHRRASLIDYTVPNEEIHGEWKMAKACKNCTVRLVTRKQKLASGALRFTTSIWTFSDDRSVRLQQKIADGQELIPYTVHGNEKKVVLRVPTELKFHDTTLDAPALYTAKTSWINFHFENERASSTFQGALIGKTLLLSVKVKRAMRIHEGISGTFAFAEQLCGLENLRLFLDPQTGGVLAMVHYTPQFHDGYLAFYLNSSRSPLRVRDEDDKTIKVKGLSIAVDDKSWMGRRGSAPSNVAKTSRSKNDTKIIKAIKIEFYTPEDKRLFKDKFKEIQSGPERFLS